MVFGSLLLCGTGLAYGQRGEDQQWFSAKVQQDVRDWRWSVEQNLRMRYGFHILDNLFTEAGLRYKVHKHVAVAAKYRIGWRMPAVAPVPYHRANLDVRLRYKWKKKLDLGLLYRTRVQVRMRRADDGPRRRWNWRNKLTLTKKLTKKIDLWAAGELFVPLDRVGDGFLPDEVRGFLGLEFDLPKRMGLKVYYMLSEEMNQRRPERRHVFGLGYVYALRKWKKAKQ